MSKRVNVKSNKDGIVEKVTEVVTKVKKTNAKETIVDGAIFKSRSEAVRILLETGMKKAEIAKKIGASYSFVQTIAGKCDYDYSKTKEKAKADTLTKKQELAAKKTIDSLPVIKEKLDTLINKKIDLDASIEKLMSDISEIEKLVDIISCETMIEELNSLKIAAK